MSSTTPADLNAVSRLLKITLAVLSLLLLVEAGRLTFELRTQADQGTAASACALRARRQSGNSTVSWIALSGCADAALAGMLKPDGYTRF